MKQCLPVILSLWTVLAAANPGSIRLPMHYKHVPFTRTNQSQGGHNLPMGGSDQRYGEYSVDIVIGGQPLRVQVDTGSSDLAVSSQHCHGCTVKVNRPYDPKESHAHPLGCDWCTAHSNRGTNTHCKVVRPYAHKQCVFYMRYADNSGFSAALFNDTFTFTDGVNGIESLKTTVVVGAIYEAHFPNPRDVDGIIGFAQHGITTTGSFTPFTRLVKEGKLRDVFATCMHPSGNGGHLYLGADGPSDSLHIQGTRLSETQWTPMLSSEGFYGVGLLDVSIGGVSLGLPSNMYTDGGCIVDSGTQDVVVPSTVYDAIQQNMEGLCGKVCLKGVCECHKKKPLQHKQLFGTGKCVPMTKAERDAFPAIEMEMTGGVKVQYPASNYLKNGAAFCDKDALDHYTIAISPGDDGYGSILGESLMQGYLVVHDRENLKMGFQPVSEGNCPGMASSETVVV